MKTTKQLLTCGTILASLILSGLAPAQTIISGPTISGGTWSPSGNPYYVTANCTINSGQTLTIQPGVIVDIAAGVSITCNGTIQAVGTPSQRITFQSFVQSQFWNDIEVNGAAGTNLFEFCDFQNANTALFFDNNPVNPNGNNMVTFSSFQNVTNGIVMRAVEANGQNGKDTTTILNCVFSNCVTYGVYGYSQGVVRDLQTWWNAALNAVVKNCYFNNVGYGCKFYISGQEYYGIIGRGYASPQIINNIFDNVAITAVSLNVNSYAGGGQGNVINNTFVNCGNASHPAFYAADPWDATVEDNVFVGCTNAIWDTGTLSRTVNFNDFYGNVTNFAGYNANYGEWIIPNRNGTLSDVSQNIGADPLFVSTNDFHLSTNSPCIDAGTPDWAWSDMCFPPSQGTAFPDLGAYGGPDACNWLTNVPMLATSPWMSQSNSVVSINWGALPRSTYEIQYITNILDTNWITLGDVTAVEKPTSQTITATNHQEYYRIQSLGRTPGN